MKGRLVEIGKGKMCCLKPQGSFDPSFNNDASKCSALIVILVPSMPLIISWMASNSSKLFSNLDNQGFQDLCNPLTKLSVVGSVVERVPTRTRAERSWIKKKARQREKTDNIWGRKYSEWYWRGFAKCSVHVWCICPNRILWRNQWALTADIPKVHTLARAEDPTSPA